MTWLAAHWLALASFATGGIASANGWLLRRCSPWAWIVSMALEPVMCWLDLRGGPATWGYLLFTLPALWNGVKGWREWGEQRWLTAEREAELIANGWTPPRTARAMRAAA